MQCVRKLPEFAETTQNNGHYAVQGHRFWYQSKAHKRFPISDLPPILHRFRDIAVDRSEIAILGYSSCVQLSWRRGSPVTISVKFSVDVNGWPRYLMP